MQQQSEFVKIVGQHQGIINNLCRIYFSNVEDQKDARQDIVLQLWKAFSKFRGESSYSTWIYRISLNTILTKVRNQSRRIQSTKIDPIEEVQIPIGPGMDDDIQLLKVVIESLKANDKAIVILYLEGYNNKEIGEILGMSTSNIGTRLHRIKTRLKNQYQKLKHATR